jgi:hypothetical protein
VSSIFTITRPISTYAASLIWSLSRLNKSRDRGSQKSLVGSLKNMEHRLADSGT